MTKAKISEYDAVAANNTDVNGVNIAEGCPPSGMNNMGREIMAALKRFQTGADGDSVTVGGSLVVSGSVTAANTATLGNVDINGGTIDGATIGGASAAAGSFTTLNTSGAVVFNDAGADVDFRVEGDTDANLLFVDASTDRVGIGTDSPVYKYDVVFSNATAYSASVLPATGSHVRITNNDTTANTQASLILRTGGAGTGNNGHVVLSNELTTANNSAFVVQTENSGVLGERMRITSAGEVLVGGSTSVDAKSGAVAIESATGGDLNLIRNDTSVSNNDVLGEIGFWGNDTTGNTRTKLGYIELAAFGAHSAGDNAAYMAFGVTADNTDTVYEAFRIRQDGSLESQDTYDNTRTGSTVVVTSDGVIGRTSSSIKYKKDVETLDANLVSNAIANLRPVWYRTKDAKGDDKETWSHIGLIAEEVHEVEPRLVRYRTEKVEFVDVEETDENGNTVTRKEKQKTPLETPEPEDVDYGRLAVLCLAKIQELEARIAALESNNGG